jgi:hypothetical protein
MRTTMSSSNGRENEEGISNVYMENILLSRCKYFRGVYSCDNIPDSFLRVKKFSIICNLSKRGDPGTHFVCIIVQPEYVLYIDTFAMSCYEPNILHFLRRLNKLVLYSVSRLQHYSSKFCGFYCMLFVLFYEQTEKRRRENRFKFCSRNLLKNDKLCTEYICRLLSKD